MRLTHLADYAVVMMTAAARRGDTVRVSAAELAQDTGVPLPTAQKLMGQLDQANVFQLTVRQTRPADAEDAQ